MSMQESIELGEMLLTSEVMDGLKTQESDRPLCLALALGLKRCP